MDQSIKNQTTPPEYGTLAGDLPKESLDKIGQQLKDMHHSLECATCKKLDTQAISWAYLSIFAHRHHIFGFRWADGNGMLDRLKAMLETE